MSKDDNNARCCIQVSSEFGYGIGVVELHRYSSSALLHSLGAHMKIVSIIRKDTQNGVSIALGYTF